MFHHTDAVVVVVAAAAFISKLLVIFHKVDSLALWHDQTGKKHAVDHRNNLTAARASMLRKDSNVAKSLNF